MGAEAAISTVVQLLTDLLVQEVKFLRGVKGDVESLKEELNRMQAFLRYANKKQHQDDRIRNWISDIREVALDAEDTIEMFILKVQNPRRRRRGSLLSWAYIPNHAHHLHIIGEEIVSISKRLQKISESHATYGINVNDLGESGDLSPEVETRRRLAAWHKDEHLVGMDDDVKKLLRPIMDQDNKGLWVAAVVGMGGIGKSTLAREIYNHPDIVSTGYNCRAWVVVSSEFTPQETFKQLIIETTSDKDEKQELLKEIKTLEELTTDRQYLPEKLREMLHRELQGKRYFIVLDDVWEKEHWNMLKASFPMEQASRLLLTSRHNNITNHCQIIHEMKLLDSEKSWDLFVKKGLTGNSNGEFPEELEQTGKQIVEKCEGLPLSITVMGGILSETRSNRVWKEALDQLCFNLGRAENSVSAILELSYRKLSPQLKCCFMCLSFFKEDATIPVKRLLNIMVGLSLIQRTRRTTTTVEEIAIGYLDELINRNVVLVKDLTLDNRVKGCHLHDSLRKICLEKSNEELGLLKRDSGKPLGKVRHWVVQYDDLTSSLVDQNKHIRSLFVLNAGEDAVEIEPNYLKSFQHLKILDLEGYFRLERLPDSFESLRGLKQFRIGKKSSKTLGKSFYRDVNKKLGESLKVPTSMNAVKKLELIDVRTEVVEFPDVEVEMDSLRHVHANRIFGTISIDRWKKVETLKYLRMEDWMKCSSELMDGCNVRVLGIFVHDNQVLGNHESSLVKASLEKLKNLVKLYLFWGYILPIDTTIIPRLSFLTKLRLRGKLRKCPSASMLPPNLSHLTLERSCLYEDPMQELSKLQKLAYLKLKNYSYMGWRIQVPRDGFPSLIGMSLQSLVRLTCVLVAEGGMPQLKLLHIDDCPALDATNLSNKSYQLQIMTDTL